MSGLRLDDPTCTICGRHIGARFDHTACSLIKKAQYDATHDRDKEERKRLREGKKVASKYRRGKFKVPE